MIAKVKQIAEEEKEGKAKALDKVEKKIKSDKLQSPIRVVLNCSGKCRNQFFLLNIFIFYNGQKTKKYPTLVHSFR